MASRITMKPLKGQVFKVTSEQGDTIKDMKRKVAEHSPEFPEDLQRLIYQGKILRDDEVVSELGMMPRQVIVVMLTTAKPSKATRSEAVVEPTVATSAGALQTASDARVATGELANGPRSLSQEEDGETAPATSEVAPGAAMQAAPLIAPVRAPELQASAGRAQPFPNPHAAGAGIATGPASLPLPPALEGLRRDPQFASMARVLLQEPSAFRYQLAGPVAGNPDLLQAIQSNFPAFLQLLQEVGSRPKLSDGNWDEMLASHPELLDEMLPEIEAEDPEMAAAIRSDPASFLAIFGRA